MAEDAVDLMSGVLSSAMAKALSMPVGERDQLSASMRDRLDEIGLTVADPTELRAYLLGMSRSASLMYDVGRATGMCGQLQLLEQAFGTEVVRTSVLVLEGGGLEWLRK